MEEKFQGRRDPRNPSCDGISYLVDLRIENPIDRNILGFLVKMHSKNVVETEAISEKGMLGKKLRV